MARPKRDTAFFAGKTSLWITEETRGVPYKWVSVFIATTYIAFGLRNVFFCGYKLPIGAGEDLIMDMWQDCKEDKVKTIFAGLHGLGDWLIAIIRFSMATAVSTQDLFFTMLVLAMYSTGFFVACLRVGIMDVSWYYVLNMTCGFLYENYVCYLAYVAYTKRNKLKTLVEETADIPLKAAFLVQALGWGLYAIKMGFFSETHYILFETESQVSFFKSTWEGSLSLPRPHVRDGWANMAGVHGYTLAGMCVFCYFTKNALALFRACGLLTLYHLGTVLLVLRAGVDVVPPTYLLFVVASLAYDGLVTYQANVEVQKFKEE